MRHAAPGSTASAALPIRRGMDVFSAYQDEYLGTVIQVTYAGTRARGQQAGAETSREHLEATPRLVHEEGAEVSPTAGAGSKVLGEEVGPVPTVAAGNTGPVTQSAAHDYATDPGRSYQSVAWFAVRPGRVNLGPFSPPLYVPVSAIRSLSLERIVLDAERAGIPKEWKQKPSRT